MERATRDEVCAQLSSVQDQLQQREQERQSERTESQRLRLRLEECERELQRLNEEGNRREALIHSLETDNKEQVCDYLLLPVHVKLAAVLQVLVKTPQ